MPTRSSRTCGRTPAAATSCACSATAGLAISTRNCCAHLADENVTDSNSTSTPPSAGVFATTRWTVVMQAGTDSPQAHQALETLCGNYWYPLYAYVRRQGHSAHDAQDLTQAFFARLLEKN